MFKAFTRHLRETENPQTYGQHFRIAFFNSLNVFWAGFQGIIHAFIPPIWPFETSTQIIKSFKILIDTKRHKAELRKHLGDGYIRKEHTRDEK